MNDELALNALRREAMFTYQLNLQKYLAELPKPTNGAPNNFDDKDFAIVGSLGTADASIVFAEGVKNLRVIAADNAAGFSGRPNPVNDKLHNRFGSCHGRRCHNGSHTDIISAAGPIGYVVAATLHVASYATGVASGLVSMEDLEPKDYVKAFLSPLIPSPDFAAMVDMFDAAARGDIATAYSIYMTKSVPAALAIGGMAVVDRLTGTTYLREHLRKLSTLLLVCKMSKYQDEKEKFEAQMKSSTGMRDLVRKIKPKKFLYAFPAFNTENEYTVEGWRNSEALKTDFEITSPLTNWIVFVATYNRKFPKPDVLSDNVYNPWDGTTFVPDLVYHGDDPFLFIGGNNTDDKVILDTKMEAYGMGGDDKFEVVPFYGSNKTGTVKN
ncbi:hypothetical protein ACROYT_G012035 [Oculina patagonica]